MAERVLVTLDGEVRDADAPLLHADDFGVLRGDGVFETLLVRGGRARALELHLARLAASAAAAQLPEPDRDDWRLAVDVALEQWGAEQEGVLRLVYTRGREGADTPTAFLLVTPVAERVGIARRDGVSVVTLERGFSTDLAQKAPWQLLGAKTLSYATNMAALRHAESVGADDVIFVSAEGYVLEGPRSTVLVARGRTLLTPPPEQGSSPAPRSRHCSTWWGAGLHGPVRAAAPGGSRRRRRSLADLQRGARGAGAHPQRARAGLAGPGGRDRRPRRRGGRRRFVSESVDTAS